MEQNTKRQHSSICLNKSENHCWSWYVNISPSMTLSMTLCLACTPPASTYMSPPAPAADVAVDVEAFFASCSCASCRASLWFLNSHFLVISRSFRSSSLLLVSLSNSAFFIRNSERTAAAEWFLLAWNPGHKKHNICSNSLLMFHFWQRIKQCLQVAEVVTHDLQCLLHTWVCTFNCTNCKICCIILRTFESQHVQGPCTPLH